MIFSTFKHSQRGSAILVSLIVLILLTMMTTVFIERIWTFSQTSKGIEASNMAYYNALGIIEEQLIYTGVTKFEPWNIRNLSESGLVNTGRSLTVTTGSTIVPAIGKGNSPFDSNYNIITLGDPIQLVIPSGVNWTAVRFIFRVPTINNRAGVINPTNNGSGYILWTFGNADSSLYASGETNIFKGQDISPAGVISNFNVLAGITNGGVEKGVGDFYTSDLGAGGILCDPYACTLKLSLIRPVPLLDGRTIPFLEYSIDFVGVSLPSQYMTLRADAYAYGFFRTRTVRIPQITTNTALDFAILQ